MKSIQHGADISAVDIVHINQHGVWLNLKGVEYFLPYDQYPWFKEARVGEILNVELFHETHLHWPELDIDLSIDILANPEKYPLDYQ